MSNKIDIVVDGVKYVRADSVQPEIVNFTGENSIASRMIGKKVICRTRNEGLNAGIVLLADESGVVLNDCRRIWFHKPRDKSMSWYEGVSLSGISADSKVSETVSSKTIIEDYSLTECTDDAFASIMESKPNEQG